MPRWLPVYIALGCSLGLVGAYLLAGGASYEPLPVADPCQPRSPEVLAERGVFEGIVLSGLDGAACDLGVSREELAAALGDDAALQQFSESHQIDQADIESAVRAGLVRGVNDAEEQGRLSTPVASLARAAAENAPVATVINLFQALPGDPSIADVISALGEAGLTLQDLGGMAQNGLDQLQGLLGGLGGLDPGSVGDQLQGLLGQ